MVWPLIAMGIAAAAQGTAAAIKEGEKAAAKRRFLRDARHDAQLTALRNQRHTDFFPTNALDARWKQMGVERQARENPAFQPDPMAFVPFVQTSSQLAGGIYDEFNKPSAPQAPQPTPEQLTKFEPAATQGPAAEAFHRPRRRIGLMPR